MGEHSITRRGFLVGSSATVGGALLGGSLLSACGVGAAPRSKKIGFAMSSFRNPRFPNLDLFNFEKAVRDAGFEPHSDQANDDPAQQANQVDNLLAQGLGALAIIPVVGPPAVSMVRKAKEQGVPVLAYNTGVPSPDISVFVSRDNVAVGEAIAQAALKDQGLTGNWVVVSGDQANAVAIEFTEGVFNVIQPRIDAGQMQVASHEWHAAFSIEDARQQAENTLTRFGDKIGGFLCNSDGLAQGVLAALEAQNLAGKMWIGGQDASEAACRGILQRKINMSSFTRFDVMGTRAGEICVQLAKGETPKTDATYELGGKQVPFVRIEAFNVTRDNLVEYLEEYSPQYVDAKNVFAGVPETEWPQGAKELLAR
ncbi:MAG: substrate-binding domain-containing protein [Vicinamibacteraceae bacterium]